MDRFLRLEDFLLPCPLPAVVSILLVLGTWFLGRRLARKLRGAAVEPVDVAAGTLLAAGAIGALVHALALSGLASVWILRPLAVLLGVAGLVALKDLRFPSPAADAPGTFDRVALSLAGLIVAALAVAALGPATDADSLDYHLGVPLDWLRHGGALARPDWFHARIVGIGEGLNLLGLAAGSDGVGALFQVAGLVAAMVAAASCGSTSRSRTLGALLVAAAPVVVSLATAQKPQLLPAAATTIAVVLGLRRRDSMDPPTFLLAAGAAMVAAGCRTNFLLTAPLALLPALLAARKAGFLPRAAVATVALAAAFVAPVWIRNALFYGDPLSPFLERWKSAPDPALVAFAGDLRDYAGPFSLKTLASIVVTTDAGLLTAVLGLGPLAGLLSLRSPGISRTLLGLSAAAIGLQLAFTQLSGRFFLEPCLWLAAAAAASTWEAPKRWVLGAVSLQAVATAGMAVVAAATLFPGAWTGSLRDRVMTKSADGYVEAKWMDAVLPADAVVLSWVRSCALLPRPFVVWHRMWGGLSVEQVDERIRRTIEEGGVTAVVRLHPSADIRIFNRFDAFGEATPHAARFQRASRNPFAPLGGYTLEVLAIPRTVKKP